MRPSACASATRPGKYCPPAFQSASPRVPGASGGAADGSSCELPDRRLHRVCALATTRGRRVSSARGRAAACRSFSGLAACRHVLFPLRRVDCDGPHGCPYGWRGRLRRTWGGSSSPAFVLDRPNALGRGPPGIAKTPALVERPSRPKPSWRAGAPARSPAFAVTGFDRTRFIARSLAFFAAARVVCAVQFMSMRWPSLPPG